MLLVDDLEPGERARVVPSVEDGIEDFERGDHMDGFDFIAQMRSGELGSSSGQDAEAVGRGK